MEGATWRAVIQSPLPYALRFDLHLRRVTADAMDVDVGGDLAGPARLDVGARDGGCAVRVQWDVAPGTAPLRAAAIVARPLLQWSHERVVGLGLAQFRRRALGV